MDLCPIEYEYRFAEYEYEYEYEYDDALDERCAVDRARSKLRAQKEQEDAEETEAVIGFSLLSPFPYVGFFRCGNHPDGDKCCAVDGRMVCCSGVKPVPYVRVVTARQSQNQRMHAEPSNVSWATERQLLGPGDPGRYLARGNPHRQ